MGDRAGRDETKTDEELAALVAAGHKEFFACIYQRYYSRVYRMAYGMTAGHDSAEDLTQEVFMRAYRKIEQFSGRSSFSTWFYRLALNQSLNYSKPNRKREHAGLAELDHLPLMNPAKQFEEKIFRREVQGQILKALLSLKPNYRLMIILKDIEGLSYEEIAEQLDCSTGTIAGQLKRARSLLARKLGHLKGSF